MFDLNKLIGIPFKLNRKDFKGCDCRGIVWLYYHFFKEKEFPFTDGKRIFFRDKRKDIKRMVSALNTFAIPITFNELKEGDIVLLRNMNNIGVMGVCINDKQLLHMDLVVGSCLTKLRYLKELFLAGYRPNV